MIQELNNFAGYINNTDKAFSEADLRANLPSIYDFLLQTGILTPCNPSRLAKCIDCDNEHYENVVEIEGKYFIKCGYSDYGSLREVQKDELLSYMFNTRAFLNWIQKELKVSGEITEQGNNIWHIGLLGKQTLYFINSSDFQNTLNLAKTVNSSNNVHLWLGDKPLTGYITINLVSIKELLRLNANSIIVKPISKSKKLSTPNKADILLDNDIVLTRNNKVLLVANKGRYDFEEAIYPQTHRITRYLYDMRKQGKALSSKEIAEALSFKNPKVVPTKIKQINTLCERHKLKQPILSYPDKTWILNPNLSCNY